MTDPPTRTRSAREIAPDVVRLFRRAAEVIDVDATTIAALRADPAVVDTMLSQLASSCRTAIASSASGPTTAHAMVAMAVEAIGLAEEWRQFIRRDTAHWREELSHSLVRLRSIRTAAELFDRVCTEACRATGADRALLARVEAGRWIPWRQLDTTTSRTESQAWQESATAPLRTLGAENGAVTSRLPTRVPGKPHPGKPRPVQDLMRRSPYAIVPIIVKDDVIGLIYVAEPTSAQWNTRDIAEHLQTFVACVGLLIERAVIIAHLEAQCSSMREALSTAGLTLAGFDADVDLVQLVGRQQAGPTPAGAARWTTPRHLLDQDFTARERDVMALLAQGMDNDEIAQQLAVARSTVKSHVQNMFRKAGAVNRAELIAQSYGTL